MRNKAKTNPHHSPPTVGPINKNKTVMTAINIVVFRVFMFLTPYFNNSKEITTCASHFIQIPLIDGKSYTRHWPAFMVNKAFTCFS